MLISSFKNLQRNYLRDPLKYLELVFFKPHAFELA